ncbi:hypothetical protein OG217_08055 [Streptomyces sp. NBC_01023]|uniref:GNAT family N-acetyltransferase n=1 Tax=Streptomyces sp. NBC_01023 TaxID=2903724 RepID=UPI00386B069A|nr:hypothetical protein OG217_08055 [Streptomyces sp. NBC_01023]
MTWTFTRDLDDFLTTAKPAVAAHPAQNTLLLTITAALKRHGPRFYGDGAPLYGWWRSPAGAVDGAVVWTPPHPLQVGVVPDEAMPSLANAFDEWGVTAVNAERSVADALTASWPDRTTTQEQRLYRLAELIPPSPCPAGRARAATAADRELLTEWHRAFGRAALDAGVAGVLLFTDVANQTSNGVYRRIGYRPVADRAVVTRTLGAAVT